MNTNKFQEEILNNAVQMDASVNFQLNGNMLIMPCSWENEKQVTNGSRVNYKAGVSVDADGRTRVKRYNVGKNGPLHETLFETRHGAVKMTRPHIRPSDEHRSPASDRRTAIRSAQPADECARSRPPPKPRWIRVRRPGRGSRRRQRW